MVGLYINTLPVRVHVSPGDCLVDWLRALQEQQVTLREYEYTPLFEIQKWSEVSCRRTPLQYARGLREYSPGKRRMPDDEEPRGSTCDQCRRREVAINRTIRSR